MLKFAKKKIFFNIVLLCVIATLTFFSVSCGDVEYGPTHNFGAQFETNKELYDFYQIFKKQNHYEVLSFDLDDNDSFDYKLYTFNGGPFNSRLKTSGNLYDYKYAAPFFAYSFSYCIDADVIAAETSKPKQEKVKIECLISVLDKVDLSLDELVYSFDGTEESLDGELDAPEVKVARKSYNYTASFNAAQVAKIQIKFVKGSSDETEQNANKVLEILKQSMVIFK